jgi:hypothetical protein
MESTFAPLKDEPDSPSTVHREQVDPAKAVSKPLKNSMTVNADARH